MQPQASDGTVAPDLDAGPFGAWVTAMEAVLAGQGDARVPCGSCTACCTSSQFVHIEPDEMDTLARIPSELLFPASRRPRGHLLLGYDEQGHCPMLRDGRCSIYEHRPRACRTYDCRIFSAAGVDHDDAGSAISHQARRWRFSFPAERDRQLHRAVRVAAASPKQMAARPAPAAPAAAASASPCEPSRRTGTSSSFTDGTGGSL